MFLQQQQQQSSNGLIAGAGSDDGDEREGAERVQNAEVKAFIAATVKDVSSAWRIEAGSKRGSRSVMLLITLYSVQSM
jgi:hypothetical protein